MITALISRLVILAFGTLYPAYASYKAVRTKDVKEYVKWMMYWIVFALFTCAETFTDVLFSFWFPFYYELKVAIVFWLLSPATKGSSFLYRNFVHPAFQKRESEIDDYLSSAKEKGYSTVMNIGTRGVSYATNVIVQTAIKGGGGIFEQIRKSYSLSDLSPKLPEARGGKQIQQQSDTDTTDLTSEPRAVPRGRRGISSPGVDMYFSEVDVNLRQYHAGEPLGEIRSTEDISSGYSSTDQLFGEGVLMRTSSVSSGRGRGRGGRVPQTRRPPLTEGYERWEDGEQISDESFPSYGDLMPNTIPSPVEPYPRNFHPQVEFRYPEFHNIPQSQYLIRSSLSFEPKASPDQVVKTSEKSIQNFQPIQNPEQTEKVVCVADDSSKMDQNSNSAQLDPCLEKEPENHVPELDDKTVIKSAESNIALKENVLNWLMSTTPSTNTEALPNGVEKTNISQDEIVTVSERDTKLADNGISSNLETKSESINNCEDDTSLARASLSSAIAELRATVELENENIHVVVPPADAAVEADTSRIAEAIYRSDKNASDTESFDTASISSLDKVESVDRPIAGLLNPSPVSGSAGSCLSLVSAKSDVSSGGADPERKGKYRKRPAPLPPTQEQSKSIEPNDVSRFQVEETNNSDESKRQTTGSVMKIETDV